MTDKLTREEFAARQNVFDWMTTLDPNSPLRKNLHLLFHRLPKEVEGPPLPTKPGSVIEATVVVSGEPHRLLRTNTEGVRRWISEKGGWWSDDEIVTFVELEKPRPKVTGEQLRAAYTAAPNNVIGWKDAAAVANGELSS